MAVSSRFCPFHACIYACYSYHHQFFHAFIYTCLHLCMLLSSILSIPPFIVSPSILDCLLPSHSVSYLFGSSLLSPSLSPSLSLSWLVSIGSRVARAISRPHYRRRCSSTRYNTSSIHILQFMPFHTRPLTRTV